MDGTFPDLVTVRVHLLPAMSAEQMTSLIDGLHGAVASAKGVPGRELNIGPTDATVMLVPDLSTEGLGVCEVYAEIGVPKDDKRFPYSGVQRPLIEAVGQCLVDFLRLTSPEVPRVEVVVVKYQHRITFTTE